MAETKLLNKLLSTNQKLAKERKSYPNNCKLTTLLEKLIEKKYKFTREQFDMFIEQACIKNIYGRSFIGSLELIIKNINIYMIRLFDMTNDQVNIVFDLIERDNNINYCINILFEKNYKFTAHHYGVLSCINYDCPIIDNFKVLHNSVIYAGCIDMLKNPGGKNYEKCLEIAAKDKGPFNIEYFDIILECLNNRGNCFRIYSIEVDLFRLLDLIFHADAKQIIFEHAIQKINCHCPMHINIVQYILGKYGYNDNFLVYVLEQVMDVSPKILLNLMLIGYKITSNEINLLLASHNYIYLDKSEIDIYEQINLTHKILTRYLVDEYIKIPIIDMFDIFKILPNIETLNCMCKSTSHYATIDILFNKYKIVPTKQTLDISVKLLNVELIRKILNYKLIPDSTTIKNILIHYTQDVSKINEVIELCINYGFVATIDDVGYLLSLRYVLPNLERFNIAYDEHLYFVCYWQSYFPDEYLSKFMIDTNVIEMHRLCREGYSFSKIIKFLKNKNLRLDRYAMELLLMSDIYVIDEIIKKYGCIPAEISIYKATKSIAMMEFAKKKYNVTTYDMFEQYEMDI